LKLMYKDAFRYFKITDVNFGTGHFLIKGLNRFAQGINGP